ncbi:hypothetical protein IU501_22505 [Nocardia otitidiscaviarum]|uniref:hypothetical protein n=1 Tax=Nocardia otitidiscaviarum TaxID=1823 RepID=UPI0006950600|nr:hypothetical protein [Nocardia otitidiscaviarum]MBF6135766.1 hypothetical protein [Nocardia otitidiscaviarum]MBF6483579.1 hypothetical protein [Nocardia otitidiscaviarum]
MVRSDADTTTVITEPTIVTTLVGPLLRLRAALGDGARPDAATLAALGAVPAAIRDSDEPHRVGATGLESARTAVAAVPAITRTRDEVSALVDTSTGLGATLAAAYATRDTAAAELDQLIADFRSKATVLANNARSQADADQIVELATDYIRDGVRVVRTANGEMDSHTATVNALGLGENAPRVSVPTGFHPGAPTWNGIGGTGGGYYGTPTYGTPTLTYRPDTATTTDPVLAAQHALQLALINGGVTLGSSLIDAGVSVGTHLIDTVAGVITHAMDKGVEVATTGIDALATVGTTAVTQAVNPATANQNNNGTGTTPGGELFPGLAPAEPEIPDDTPDLSFNLGDEPVELAPHPSAPDTGNSAPQQDSAPSAGVPEEDAGPGPGGVLPPPIVAQPAPQEERPPRRDGQLGVTPAARTS